MMNYSFICAIKQTYVTSSHTHTQTVQHTSWKSCDISHTRQEFDCISHLCLSERKKSRSSGVCVRAWTIQFMKHVLPRFINPRKPAGQEEKEKCESNMATKIKQDSASDSYCCQRREFKSMLKDLISVSLDTGLAVLNLLIRNHQN